MESQNAELHDENADLRAQLEWFKRNLVGTGKSEKIDALQTRLGLGEEPIPEAFEPQKETITYVRRKRSKRDLPLSVSPTFQLKRPSRSFRMRSAPIRTFTNASASPRRPLKCGSLRQAYGSVRSCARSSATTGLEPAAAISASITACHRRRLCLRAADRLHRAEQIPLSSASLPAGEDVGTLGRAALTQEHGRLDCRSRRLVQSNLRADAPQPSRGRRLRAGRRDTGPL